MLTLTAMLFASSVAMAGPKYWWEQKAPPETQKPAVTALGPKKPESPKPPKPPGICKRFPYACLVDAFGPPDDYQNGGPDIGGGSGGY